MNAAREFVFGWLGWLLVEAFDKALTVAERIAGDPFAEWLADRIHWLYRAGCRSYDIAYRLSSRYN